MVRLAEEIVRELKPEEFGLDPEMVKQCEEDPSKAFEIIMNSTITNPERLQGAMSRIVKRLQEKFRRGEFNPRELASEAEEMMKEFSENPAFVQMMEAMRTSFGSQDTNPGRAGSRDGSARLSMVRDRLRRKLEAKKQGKN